VGQYCHDTTKSIIGGHLLRKIELLIQQQLPNVIIVRKKLMDHQEMLPVYYCPHINIPSTNPCVYYMCSLLPETHYLLFLLIVLYTFLFVVMSCSATGKRLMTKCRMLLQENQELGKQLSQGKIAQLEAEIALQKKYSQELKTSQDGKWAWRNPVV